VKIRKVHSANPASVEDADVTVATSWETAEWVAEYPRSKGAGFYLVQDLESWSGDRDRISATFRSGLRVIVISRWLQEVVSSHGQEAYYIPNGLDWNTFGMDVNPEDRMRPTVAFLVHNDERKGSRDALKAIEMARHSRPDLSAASFGVAPRPRWLPHWVSYLRRPGPAALRSLYNSAAVFVSMSRQEGWGLTPCEAMMCGCAAVVTDVGGHREFAHDGETARVVSVGNVAAAADKIRELLENPALREKLAHEGNRFLKRFSWDTSVSRLETILATADQENTGVAGEGA
jgi:glycosyltransferase involved in cell wall biosynthesis